MKIIKERDYNVKKDQKYRLRIARYNEFDNGHVLFKSQMMYPDDAEKLAKSKSIEDATDVYYVSYDDMMLDNPNGKYWFKGKSFDSSEDALNSLKKERKEV